MASADSSSSSEYPFFSIVTISFNQSEYLGHCLQSVKQQDYLSFEHIVVDPGSTDGSRSIILNESNRVRAIFEKDSGPADGLNRGFCAAKGVYAIFINADDFLLPGALKNAYTLLQTYSWPDLLFLGGIKTFSDTHYTEKVFPGTTSSFLQAIGLSHFFQQGAVIKLSAYRQTNLFNPSNKTCWDADLFFQILSTPHMRVMRNPCPIAAFRIHSRSISGSQRLQSLYYEEIDSIIKALYPTLVVASRNLVGKQPSLLRILFKYMSDLKLAYWIIRFRVFSR